VRLAVVGDFHCGEEDGGRYRELFARANDEADVLLLAGDLTRRGTPAEFRIVAGELADVRIPILAVLGNHDHESGKVEEGLAILRERGVHVLDGEPFELNPQVGFAGVKGFMGGFGRWTLTAFGEAETKVFVGTTLEEAQRLEFALRRLSTPVRVVLMHYSPSADTVAGEPEQIFPFLGNDRMAEPIDRFGAAVVFHGHAHHGTFRGKTPGGVPVFNVSLALLRQEGVGEMYFLYDVEVPAGLDEEEGATAGAGSGVRSSARESA
jgi:Icc-related predicted phosphoesterase